MHTKHTHSLTHSLFLLCIRAQRGNLAWVAPEAMNALTKFESHSDVYSYGIIVWEVLTRAVPFSGLSVQVH